ncbi:F-box only protein 6 isoform X1 [Lynx rufus]|uniref:F-box only protein 6 isoform X1 n=1 Tax=Lynx rufus TaxID=61384 RepID=UPI001F1230AE|nr:F-box only protein 6 isoform X1 [Lynx rufus]XP_046939589.1 F-box only protein 6 isoform X1 [Lynx rufus]
MAPVSINDLPENILLEVFTHVPARQLLLRCRLVCSLWRDLIDLVTLWKRKCLREGFITEDGDQPVADWKIFYFLRSLHRNLLRNPCAEDFKVQTSWVLLAPLRPVSAMMPSHSRGYGFLADRFQRRRPLEGGEPPRRPRDRLSRLQSQEVLCHIFWEYEFTKVPSLGPLHWGHMPPRHRMCLKSQLVDLKAEGYGEELLDTFRPDIVVKDWFAARADCGCTYHIRVQLASADYIVLASFEPPPVTIDQWNNAKWTEVSYTFSDYPPGVRHILFQHGGKDTQFWAGWYGPRVTNSSIVISPKMTRNLAPCTALPETTEG